MNDADLEFTGARGGSSSSSSSVLHGVSLGTAKAGGPSRLVHGARFAWAFCSAEYLRRRAAARAAAMCGAIGRSRINKTRNHRLKHEGARRTPQACSNTTKLRPTHEAKHYHQRRTAHAALPNLHRHDRRLSTAEHTRTQRHNLLLRNAWMYRSSPSIMY